MRTLLPVVCISLCVIAGCSKELPTMVEYLDGNCVGAVKDAAGAPVKGASIMLVPEEYSPLAADAGRGIDFTFV